MPKSPVKVYYSALWGCSYQWFNGGWVPITIAAALTAVEAAGWSDWGRIRLSQGGLSTVVYASAGTHDGLGAFDIAVDGRSKAKVWRLSARLLRSGIVAFPRGYVADSFQNNKHIHCVSLERQQSLSWSAEYQLNNRTYGYMRKVGGKRGAGLGGRPSMRYTGPSTPPERWAASPYSPANITADTNTYTVDTNVLLGLSVDRNVKFSRKRGFRITAARRVKRWGRANIVTKYGTYYALSFLRKVT